MAAPPTSFAALFGGQKTTVDYATQPNPRDNPLPLPELDDSLVDVTKKLNALADVVMKGLSVAVFTGVKKAVRQTMDAAANVVKEMKPMEKLQYDAWKAGVKMPSIDWNTSVLPVPQGRGSAKRFRLRAEAMRIIWGQEGLGPEHASWIVTNKTCILPIIAAVVRVEGAKRDLPRVQKMISKMDIAEVQTIHMAVAIASNKEKEVYSAPHLISISIDAACEALQAREHALKAGIEGYRPPKDPINDQRAAVGLPKFSRQVDYRAKAAGERAPRTDLLGRTGLTRPAGVRRPRAAPASNAAAVRQIAQLEAPAQLPLEGLHSRSASA